MDTAQLTAEAIDAMPAGPEMDALVAERVMGWARIDDYDVPLKDGSILHTKVGKAPGRFEAQIPHYSTDIAAAWRVVGHINEIQAQDTPPWDEYQCLHLQYKGGGWWVASFDVVAGEHELFEWAGSIGSRIEGGKYRHLILEASEYFLLTAGGETAPLAICRAALKATLPQKPE